MKGLKGHQKVFGLGLSKTGTASLGEALNMLGINSIHWPHDQKTYDDLRNGNYRLSILQEYQGIVDIPVAPYYAQLDRIYPGSKFILTVRDKDSWIRSAEVHWRLKMETSDGKSPEKDLELEFAEFISACVYGTIKFNRDRFLHVYDTHLRNVCDYFENRPKDFLIMDICGGDGWEKLCHFLGYSVPKTRFPHANRWRKDRLEIPGDIAALVPVGETFILVDQDRLGSEVAAGRRRIPFLEQDGQYWGTPPDDETAIRELERLRRQSRASFMVFAWPAFWWLEYYSELHRHLRSTFRCVMENDRLVAFDLRP
jgi:Sulfotransferase domain